MGALTDRTNRMHNSFGACRRVIDHHGDDRAMPSEVWSLRRHRHALTRCDQPNCLLCHSNFPLPRPVVRHHHPDVTCDVAGVQHGVATPCKRNSLPCNVSRHLTAPAHSVALPTLPTVPLALYIVPMTFPTTMDCWHEGKLP